MKKLLVIMLTMLSVSSYAKSTFVDGPVIFGYGKHATVKQDYVLEKNAYFKVAFDISEQGEHSVVNRNIDTLARFINMHVANGVLLNNIDLALVVHGKAGFDLLNNIEYKKKFSQNNPNTKLLTKLLKNKTKIILCGQSAAYYKIENNQLEDGVQMALSAMTAHTMLQSQGYSLNPF